MILSAPLEGAPRWKRVLVYGWAVLVALAPMPGLILIGGGMAAAVMALIGAPLIFGSLLLARSAGRYGARYAVYVLTAVLALVILPLMGLGVDAAADDCRTTCDPNYRPLAMPEVFVLVPLQVAAAYAFFLSLRRREALRPRAEAAIVTGLFVGVVLHLVLAVQFVAAVPLAMFIIPLPSLTPYLTLPLLIHQLLWRLRERGREALGRGLAGVPVVLGLHGVVSAAIFSSPTGGVDAFLRTCGYALSSLPVPPPEHCHYLCTIAAQGSPALVKPYRWGSRRGRLILVNRQLAIANAFEDLLHERWPRLGRLARRTYDALAFPISGVLSRRWVANALYIAMKPAEALFFAALLFFDPEDPEARIDRMYRDQAPDHQ